MNRIDDMSFCQDSIEDILMLPGLGSREYRLPRQVLDLLSGSQHTATTDVVHLKKYFFQFLKEVYGSFQLHNSLRFTTLKIKSRLALILSRFAACGSTLLGIFQYY